MHYNLSMDGTPVRTALLLAAGTGSRLSPLTDSTPKCLVEVNGIPILERLIRSLRSHGFKRLVVVVGHLSEVIRDYLGSRYADIEITYITSPRYKTTNNIYSLWLAGKVIDEPFLLIESDLVFHSELLKPMLQPDRIAVSKLLPWMNGTTVTLNERQQLDALWLSTVNRNDAAHFKTVNIYSFSRSTWQAIWERLDRHISAKKVKGYYESVFAELVAEENLTFAPVFFDAARWYEIDTLEDLSAAEKMFPGPSPIKVATQQLQPLVQKVAPIVARNMTEIKNTVIGENLPAPFSPLVASD
ncbi:MAG: phosphocholine cytidylyltransferase family protein [Deltaproteobacteria bacterium]|nr:phosphocholine cytidylyltransferase family protein [Deltaproteobacteria bacterium]